MSDDNIRLINLRINTGPELEKIRARLGDLSDKAPNVLAKAVNDVARQVRRQITKDARGEYVLREKRDLATKAVSMSNATRGNLTATLTSKGPMLDLMEFLVTPQQALRGASRPNTYAAQVRKLGGMKPLNGKPKPFVTTFPNSGHIAVAVRVPGKKMKSDPQRDFIKKLLSPAVPHMLGNEKIRARAETMVEEQLPAAIEKQIAKLLAKGMVV